MIIFIPGFLIALLTFPGVILHEMAHKFFCDYYGIIVYKVNYFRLSSNAGHVVHAKAFNHEQEAIISLAPLLINSTICLILLTQYILMWSLGTLCLWDVKMIDVFLIWVGISCGLSALPSKTDLSHITSETHKKYRFFSTIIKILNFLEFLGAIFWLFILVGIYYPIISLIINFV